MGIRYGGRQKGTPNKATADIRAALSKLARTNMPKLQAWIEAVEDPARRAALLLDLCEYCVPKLARTELTGKDGDPLHVKVLRFDGNESSFTGVRPRITMNSGEANSVANKVEQKEHR